MKTRYTSLVNVKKSIMQKSEEAFQSANEVLNNATIALKTSTDSLNDIDIPKIGKMPKFLSSRMLLDAQREVISHNEEWVEFANKEMQVVKEQLKFDTIEYEKFNYLELQEIKIQLKKAKVLEAKELDEIALMTYGINKEKKDFF